MEIFFFRFVHSFMSHTQFTNDIIILSEACTRSVDVSTSKVHEMEGLCSSSSKVSKIPLYNFNNYSKAFLVKT